MKERGMFIFLLLLILFSWGVWGRTNRITGYQTAAQTKEVDVAAGWNLISFPKVTIKSTALGDLQPAIYQFKDAKWERFTAQQFEPNTAYFMDFIQSGKIKVPITTSQPNVQLKQGWNVIGVSIDVKIKEGKIKSVGQEYALKNKVTALYVFNAEQQKWSSVTINDDVSLVPGKGYLVYAQVAGELNFEKEAPTKTFTGDNFEDGDYTQNPTWKVIHYGNQQPLEGDVRVIAGPSPNLFSNVLYGRNIMIATPTSPTQAYGKWEFDLNNYNPYRTDRRTFPRLYFIASHEDMLTSGQKKGYYFYIDWSNDFYPVFPKNSKMGIMKVTDGRETPIVSGTPPSDAFTGDVSRVTIVRDNTGKFTLKVNDRIFEGTDNEITTSNYFVVTGKPHAETGGGTLYFVIDNIRLSFSTEVPLRQTN